MLKNTNNYYKQRVLPRYSIVILKNQQTKILSKEKMLTYAMFMQSLWST